MHSAGGTVIAVFVASIAAGQGPDDFYWSEQFRSVERWTAQASWLGNPSPTATVTGEAPTPSLTPAKANWRPATFVSLHILDVLADQIRKCNSRAEQDRFCPSSSSGLNPESRV